MDLIDIPAISTGSRASMVAAIAALTLAYVGWFGASQLAAAQLACEAGTTTPTATPSPRFQALRARPRRQHK